MQELRLRQSSLESSTSDLQEKLSLLKSEQEKLSVQLKEELELELKTVEESYAEQKLSNEAEVLSFNFVCGSRVPLILGCACAPFVICLPRASFDDF